MMKKLAVIVSLVMWLPGVLCGSSAHAVVRADERIKSFDSQVHITRDNVAHVKETIVYDFGSKEHYGIYRDIPFNYHDGNTHYFITVHYGDTTIDAGQEVPATVREVKMNERLKIGDGMHAITGVHTYVITYTLSPIVMQKDGKPFLNLNVLGNGWQVPVDHFSAGVTLQDGAQLSNIAWYDAPGATATVTRDAVPAYTGITINAYLPAGYVSTYLTPNVPRPFNIKDFLFKTSILFVILIVLVCVGLIVGVRRWRRHLKRHAQTVIPEYGPPAGMSPAAVGLLQDDRSETRELTATVINWAVRGYLKIARVEKTHWFGSTTYALTRLKPGADLAAEEQPLFAAFFDKGETVTLKGLEKIRMTAAITDFDAAIKAQLTAKGYYAKDGGLFAKGALTDAGARQWAKVDGFKLYLGVVEKDRLDFSDAPERTPERFNAMLPYAIALGVEKKWAKQFEGIDISGACTWYDANMATFNAINLASEIGKNFAMTVSSSSGVSTSGGVAGGGFGGGGGGSW